MGIQADIKDALDGDRDDLVGALARHRVLPTVVEGSGGSGLLGKSSSPTFTFDSMGEETKTVDRQTTAHVVNALGLDSEDDCEDVREEIKSHSAWDG